MLIPDYRFKELTDKGIFDKNSIMNFAKEEGIDTGIVVGRLQKEGWIKYNCYNELKTKYQSAT